MLGRAAYQKGPKLGFGGLACPVCQQIAERLATFAALVPPHREEKVRSLRRQLTAEVRQAQRQGKTLRGPGQFGQLRDRLVAVERILEPPVSHRPPTARGEELLLLAHNLSALFDHWSDAIQTRTETVRMALDRHLHDAPAWLRAVGDTVVTRLRTALADPPARWARRRDAAVCVVLSQWRGVSPLTVRRALRRHAATLSAAVRAARRHPLAVDQTVAGLSPRSPDRRRAPVDPARPHVPERRHCPRCGDPWDGVSTHACPTRRTVRPTTRAVMLFSLRRLVRFSETGDVRWLGVARATLADLARHQ